MARSNQLVRQIALLRELSNCSIAGSKVTIGELTKRLGTSRRTIYRDIDALDRAGFKTVGNSRGSNRGGIKLLNPLTFSAKNLDFDDIVSLYLSDELLSLKVSDPDAYIHRLLTDLECNVKDNDLSLLKKVRSLVQVNKPFRRKNKGSRASVRKIKKSLDYSFIFMVV